MKVNSTPECFGKFERGQAAAERDCRCCLELDNCKSFSETKELNAADVLVGMAETYRERNAVYGDNYKMVGKLMEILFPNGVSAQLLHSDKFHLFELKLVKISRFAVSAMTHSDSIHDDAVYSAMIEAILTEERKAK